MSVPRFWREIPERYTLQATRCGACQDVHFPAREVCPSCRRASIGKMTHVKLSGKGHILEWTRVHRPAPGYQLQVPYALAIVQTLEGPRITGQVVDTEPDRIEVGAPVQAVFRRLGSDGESGVIYYGTKWQVNPWETPPPEAESRKAKKDKKERKSRRRKN